MSSVNKVILIGNLGKDPEVRHFDNGGVKASMTMATSRSWKDKDGQKVEKTDWHRLSASDTLAKLCEQYLQKGSKVYIEGRLHTYSYVNKDGENVYVTEVVVQNLQFLSNTRQSNESHPSMGTPQEAQSPPAQPGSQAIIDDLPF